MRPTRHRRARLAQIPARLAALIGLVLGTAGLGAAAAPAGAPAVLYDGRKNSMPDTQGWAYLAIGGGAASTLAGRATTLDTSSSKATMAGYFAAQGGFLGSTAPVPALDRAIGYTVAISAQVELEDHSGSDKNKDGTADRAGFSLIVLSSDRRGIELGFWKDRIWAQEGGAGGALFTQAERAPFDTQSRGRLYLLAVQGDSYALSSDGAPILGGSLRDYTAATGFPNPYETPNLIFLGDDTSSASARVQLAYVAVGPIEGGAPVLAHTTYVPLVGR